MTNIVVLIKQVPDTWSERKLTDGDFTLDREAADAGVEHADAGRRCSVHWGAQSSFAALQHAAHPV